jgi:hypothetical protein
MHRIATRRINSTKWLHREFVLNSKQTVTKEKSV